MALLQSDPLTNDSVSSIKALESISPVSSRSPSAVNLVHTPALVSFMSFGK